jgi:hypothetical protein
VAHFHPAPTGLHTGDFAFTNDIFNSAAASTAIVTAVNKSFFFARSGTPSTALLTYVANQFSHSGEYYDDVVMSAYQQLLDRPAEPGAITGWAGQLQAGMRDEDLEMAIVLSPEFISKSASYAGGWVESLYVHLLNRPGSSSEWSTWAGQSPAAVAHAIIYSFEHESQVISADYQALLGRSGSGDLGGWVNALQSGMRNEDVLGYIAGSAECFNHFNDDDVAWVLDAGYEGILHRSVQSGETGYLYFLGELENGVPGIPF